MVATDRRAHNVSLALPHNSLMPMLP